MHPIEAFRRKTLYFSILTIGLAMTCAAMADSADSPEPQDTAAAVARLTDIKTALNKNPKDFHTLKEAGILSSRLAQDNPKPYTAQAVDFLTRAHDLDNPDDEVLCYLGSAVTMMARTTMNPLKKSGYVSKGCGLMDKAVRRSPENITVRMTRAANSMALPGFLNRKSFAFEDYEYLAQRFEKEPYLPAGLKKTVYDNLSRLYRQDGKTSLRPPGGGSIA
jgi:hypothetical protein